jgi:hypothetical protein
MNNLKIKTTGVISIEVIMLSSYWLTIRPGKDFSQVILQLEIL